MEEREWTEGHVKWRISLFANIGGAEEFVLQLVAEMPELVDATLIDEPERQKVKDAIMAISIEGLMPAFEHLKKIRESVGQKLPELNRKQQYEDFTIVLWRFYKDLTQRAAKLLEPEFGFLFQNDTNFEAGLVDWGKKRAIAHVVAPYLRTKRSEWQNDLAQFRNYLEHKSDIDAARFQHHYDPAHASMIFEAVWRTIADIIAMLVSLHFPADTTLVEIPPEDRTPPRRRRFCFRIEGFSPPTSREH